MPEKRVKSGRKMQAKLAKRMSTVFPSRSTPDSSMIGPAIAGIIAGAINTGEYGRSQIDNQSEDDELPDMFPDDLNGSFDRLPGT